MIPKIIHQTWKDKDIPLDIYKKEWIKSWDKYNPGWVHILWTDSAIYGEVQKHRPDLLPILAEEGVTRSQICRFLMLTIYGGLYVDLDYECFKSFDEFLDREFLFTQAVESKNAISDALMMAEKDNQFFHRVLDECLVRFQCGKSIYPQIEQRLSFFMLTDMIHKYDMLKHVMSAQLFSPFDWTAQEAIASGMTEEKRQEILSRYPQAFAATYWTHNWK